MPPEAAHTRMSGEDRRKQLIEVAIDLFSEKGFSGTTTKEIAAAAGVTEAIIFRHFATKQELYKAILDYKCDRNDAEAWLDEIRVLMDAEDDEGVFRFLLAKIVAFDREQPKFARLLIHAALEGHELAIMHHAQLAIPVGLKFKEYIAKRQAAGAIQGSEPGAVTLALAGVATYYAMQKYIFRHSPIQCDDDWMVDHLLRIITGGLIVKNDTTAVHNGTKATGGSIVHEGNVNGTGAHRTGKRGVRVKAADRKSKLA
jgi:TetR/AcrR family transcriptional regulator